MNSVGNFITSVKAVMIAMFLIIIALVFDSHTLFIRTLPGDMSPFTKHVLHGAWPLVLSLQYYLLQPMQTMYTNVQMCF